MKFTINREKLLKPLQHVSGVVERRQTMPVLSNVLLEVSENNLSLTGTDMELELVATLGLEGEVVAGETTVPARKLLDICKSLPSEADLRFDMDGERLVMKSGRSRFTLSTLPASEFPNLEENAFTNDFKLVASNLQSVIDATAFSMAQQDVRYYLNGMLFELTSERLRTVATDGHRLSLADYQLNTGIGTPAQVILPRKGVLEMSRLLSDAGNDEVSLYLGNSHLRISIGDIAFTSKLVDGKFPDYERVIPRDSTREVKADRESLRHALSRVAILSNEKYRGVRLTLTEGSLRLQANNPEQEEAEEEVLIEYEGSELQIGFNVSYLLDALNAMSGPVATLNLGDGNSSAVLVDPQVPDNLYVVMPMRL